MKSNVGRIVLLTACAAALALIVAACQPERAGQSQASAVQERPKVIEAAWTDAAAKRTAALLKTRKLEYALPELRIYNARQQLIFHEKGALTGKVATAVAAAIAADRPIDGPGFSETVGELETSDHRPAVEALSDPKQVIIVDYWADWCVPCKALEKELLAWAGTQSGDDLMIVRAEADLTKLARANGRKTYMIKKGPDGKQIKVEITG